MNRHQASSAKASGMREAAMYRLERASVVQSDRATGEGDPGRCCADRVVPEEIELDEAPTPRVADCAPT